MKEIILTEPDDWHCHLRSGDYLSRTVVDHAAQFARAIVMPNLAEPVVTMSQVHDYHAAILSHRPEGSTFTPLMTLYLTEQMSPESLQAAKDSDLVFAIKLYPQGATTLSDAGVSDIKRIYPLLEAMQALDLVLCIHGEVTTKKVDIFDREAQFLVECLQPIVANFPKLRIVLEHISSAAAVSFVEQAPANVAATITPQHLLLNRNHLLAGGIRPYYYCLPIVKKASDQAAIIAAAISGNPKFFLGTDSAPHAVEDKLSPCGCAGIYSAPAAIELYAEVFVRHQSLIKLNNFASQFGADFYQLAVNKNKICLREQEWKVPSSLPFGEKQVVPLWAGKRLRYKREAL
jgi:dihydroorotase